MSCPSCGHENPAGARFCNDCGARLAAPATAPEPRSYTPRHLVEKILAFKSALEGERKPVTVLFADVVRSMELAERVDPEEWHRLLDRLFRILADGVHRYEGTINQYTGDGIMALFGAPIAHEDHAQRACAAALDLPRELASLERSLREAQSGRPRVVLVSAEPGAGKSRLCHELVERARGVALHHARALSHGRMVPFHVMVALARSLFGVGEGASPPDVRNAVRRALGNATPDPIALDFWLELLGVSDHGPAP